MALLLLAAVGCSDPPGPVGGAADADAARDALDPFDAWEPIPPDVILDDANLPVPVPDASSLDDATLDDDVSGEPGDAVGEPGDAVGEPGDAIGDPPDAPTIPDDAEPVDPGDPPPPRPLVWRFEPLWERGALAAFASAECVYASPISYREGDRNEIVVTVGDVVLGVDATTGDTLWTVPLPEPDGASRAFAIATPARIGDLLVVGYQVRPHDGAETVLDEGATGTGAAHRRNAHHVAVVDLAARALAADFPVVTLSARVPAIGGGEAVFEANHALLRSDLAHLPHPSDPDALGTVYLTYGNARDIQPWYGWAFEVDLDAWRAEGAEAAVTGVLNTTPEPASNCGPRGSSGSFDRRCGGGLWAPAGLLVTADGSLIAAPGNGQLDVERGTYANTLMRLDRGLDFDPGCDPDLCADFDRDEPDRACIASCERLFVPRTLHGEPNALPANGVCDGLSFFECWASLDYIGGSTPVEVAVGDHRVLAYPTKDGHIYLVDAEHLGTLHDRVQLVDYCGTPDDRCRWGWAGMIVTKPAVVDVAGTPRLLVPTFMPDRTHPAGVVALDVVLEGDRPTLRVAWRWPDFASPEAVDRFRYHPTNAAIVAGWGRQIAVLAETHANRPDTLHALDVRTGERLTSLDLPASAYRFVTPLTDSNRVFFSQCGGDAGPGRLYGYRLQLYAPPLAD